MLHIKTEYISVSAIHFQFAIIDLQRRFVRTPRIPSPPPPLRSSSYAPATGPRCFNLFQLRNLTIVSTIFCPWIVGNLSVVLIWFSIGKSCHCFNNFLSLDCGKSIRCFNNFLSLYCRKSIRCFTLFFNWKI